MPPASPADEPRIPVSVLTGFLGSGKTTVLSRLLQNPAMAGTAVVINEFGEVGLDHDLVARSDESVYELTSGCLCCTLRGDLIRTLATLRLQRERGEILKFQRLVIETTGLADPAPILHALMNPPLVRDYRLGAVLTTVDAVNGMDTLDRHAESVKQVAVADRLLLTKTDIADTGALGELRERLDALNPGVPLHETLHGEITPDLLLTAGPYEPEAKHTDVQGWLREEAVNQQASHEHHHHYDVNRHDEHIRAYCVVREQPVAPEALISLLDTLAMLGGAQLLRVKGIVKVAGREETPAVVHMVQHVPHSVVGLPAWPSEDRRTRLVFITRDLPREMLEKLVDSLLGPA